MRFQITYLKYVIDGTILLHFISCFFFKPLASTLFKIVASIVIFAGLSMLVEFKTSGRMLKTKENSEDNQKTTKSSLSGKEKELAVYLFLFFVLCVGSGRI